jgi:hypothetical protein
MSNYLAIATVTAALQQILLGPVSAAVSGANVGFRRPDGKESGEKGPLVNIYLYRVTPNAAYRNCDLPTRRADGSLAKKTLTALDLNYLLTFHGSDDQLQPQRMLGAVASALDAQPLLSPQNIQKAETEFSFLAGSGLENQVDRVRFTPIALTLEEFTKLWSAFFQVEYSLSAAYQASVVLIESDDVPQEALPVQARNIYVMPFRQPVITQVISAAGANQPILPTSTLLIKGENLLSDSTTVQLGNLTVTPNLVTESTVTLPVPANMPAGISGVQIIQQLQLGTPAQPHSGFDSNVAAMVLHPVIVPTSATAAQIKLTISPPVQPAQRVTLLLNEATLPPPTPPMAYTFTLSPVTVSTSALTFVISGVKGGGTKYFIRLAVDGAESPLDFNPASPTFGPTVTIA